ncbi:MAG: succinyldiaminopimelate transaminase [Burkholderiaceae bacterium]
MNPLFERLHPYPFERYRVLLQSASPPDDLAPVDLSIGEPKHPTPAVLRDALVADLDGLGRYPSTAGIPQLREAIAGWLMRRFSPVAIDPGTNVLPVLGSREALFAVAQTILNPYADDVVLCPNPFYQIYEGAALMTGATPVYVPLTPDAAMTMDWSSVATDIWPRVRLVYVCSPGNPTGTVMKLDEWRYLFEQSDKFGFVIAADECYSELYRSGDIPPIGGLQAAATLGRDLTRLVAFGSLSKRSNAPGLRSGYVAGDPAIIAQFLKYRTYHGSAMSPIVQSASIAAWNDEEHVIANRALYDEKFTALAPILSSVVDIEMPQAGFYFWAKVRDGNDQSFSQRAYHQYNVRVLPGSFLGRESNGQNPGAGRIRIALVDTLDQCLIAARRLQKMAA